MQKNWAWHHPEGDHAPLTEKHYFYLNSSGAFHDRDSSSFKTFYKQHGIGLSFEVYNSFLPQLATKLRGVESGSPEKVPEL